MRIDEVRGGRPAPRPTGGKRRGMLGSGSEVPGATSTATGVSERMGKDAKNRDETGDRANGPRRGDGPLNVGTSRRAGGCSGGRADSAEHHADALDSSAPTRSRLSPANDQGPGTGASGERPDDPRAPGTNGSPGCITRYFR